MRRARLFCLFSALTLAACESPPSSTSTSSSARATPPPTVATAAEGATATAAQSVAAPAPTASPAFKGTTVSLPSKDKKASGYLSLPEGAAAGKRPAIIVIQEWWGLNDWIKENTDRFAKQGYVALAVDLYRGKATADPGAAHELMRGLPDDRAADDLNASFAFLAGRADVDPARIGAVGWCMGGGYALSLAVQEAKLKAVAMNYGRLVTAKESIAKVGASLLGNFAGDDQGIPVDDVRAFEKAMGAAGKSADIKIYQGAGHAFMNPNNKGGFNKAAADDAWTRIDAFFKAKL